MEQKMKFRRVGDWVLEWNSESPRTVLAHPEYLKINRMTCDGLLWDSGVIAWDYPERVPAYVRNVAAGFVRKCNGVK